MGSVIDRYYRFRVVLEPDHRARVLAVRGISRNKSRESQVIAQARPIVQLLEAVKDSGVGRIKSAWSRRTISTINPDGTDEHWKKVLDLYRQVLKREFGQYQITDFKFEFEGNEEKGEVIATFKGWA